ncbi:MAG: nuclear transport factor 2 family protein [Deltaproteobacteria bacterium]|nr:nuclear transport factor 2 family protein [Deltaproteobacteria bacterium]
MDDLEQLRLHAEKLAILEVLARYALTIDVGDVEAFAEIFAEDGAWVWEEGGLVFQGRSELKELAAAVSQHLPGGQHLMTNHVVEVNGSRAEARCQFAVLLSRPERVYVTLVGEYRDLLEKRQGRWFLGRRQALVKNPEILAEPKVGEYYAGFVQAMQERASRRSHV